jgi:8-oxo-dGTP diphosphatase
MINYYSNLAKKHGGEIIGYYRNGICIIINEKIAMEMDTENVNSEKFIITERLHQKIIEGFPFDSLGPLQFLAQKV